jgi:glycogen synthase
MTHLIISREYPPFPYPPGGIATYVDHLSRLLADHGETVHVIGQLWPGAPRERESQMGGRLIVHRVPLDRPLPGSDPAAAATLKALQRSAAPVQAFAWQVAYLAESLIENEAIDLIEAQEYEAPLYSLLVRRSRGLRIGRHVPVIVHLHSPSEFIFQHNEWDLGRADYEPLKRLEEYTIRAADALLCPSRFLARNVERHYQLSPNSITVLPYPVGDTPTMTRNAETWVSGSICYIGRLEPRKGVSEWIDAAVGVAAHDPSPRFSLIGGDPVHWGMGGRSMRDTLRARIPTVLQDRFTFVDAVPRTQLFDHLKSARIAVVPSRWENFPNTCIEAMASGLPVLVSPTGGMAEMIEDGRTGWITAGSDSQSLRAGLMRALATPPSALADMGRAAAAAIRIQCDNKDTVRRHMDFRRQVVSRRPRNRDVAVLAAIADEIDVLLRASDGCSTQSAHTMTPLDVLRATPRQQLAVLRRALADPGYVVQWLRWHSRRALGRNRDSER